MASTGNNNSGHIHRFQNTRNTKHGYTRHAHTQAKMDGSTIAFILIMLCLFIYTIKRRSAKQAPTRTVQDAKTATVTAATYEPSPEPVPVQEERVAQPKTNRVNRKRPVNNDMVEIVMTMAPHVPQGKVVQDLRNTGSIERTMENIFAGKLD
ncbi:hypothetical protein SMKI_13G0330 [Saccharomyces mikatae IFO 1815]|uniref:CUE domain-containing protein n=1 Tax=Saccharomyces mikatae IFO 1815 TaxID=226126 RepID=A0AA35NC92_SACMI|nr:uncharacterized protein SMKI_13G0330 [Saccharomyces mikatae IFO 1815]CAI4035385.1 hypothetical protein SMKI_13G0330 [Saccharomyces mikatae IFO 1815]